MRLESKHYTSHVQECAQRTQRKLLDLASSMGISDRILRMADRRNKGDAMIVYGGMVRALRSVLCTQRRLRNLVWRSDSQQNGQAACRHFYVLHTCLCLQPLIELLRYSTLQVRTMSLVGKNPE